MSPAALSVNINTNCFTVCTFSKFLGAKNGSISTQAIVEIPFEIARANDSPELRVDSDIVRVNFSDDSSEDASVTLWSAPKTHSREKYSLDDSECGIHSVLG